MRTLRMRAGLRAWWRRQSARHRRQHARAIAVVLFVLALAGLSITCGDALWEGPLASTRSETVLTPIATPAPTATAALAPTEAAALSEAVWIPWSGTRYHASASCSNMQGAQAVTLGEALSMGFTACKRCNPPE